MFWNHRSAAEFSSYLSEGRLPTGNGRGNVSIGLSGSDAIAYPVPVQVFGTGSQDQARTTWIGGRSEHGTRSCDVGTRYSSCFFELSGAGRDITGHPGITNKDAWSVQRCVFGSVGSSSRAWEFSGMSMVCELSGMMVCSHFSARAVATCDR